MDRPETAGPPSAGQSSRSIGVVVQLSADKPSVLMCKWQPQLAAALAHLPLSRYLILDSYDRRRLVDEELQEAFSRVYSISSFDSLEELAGVVGDLMVDGITIDQVLSHHEFSQLGAAYLESALVGDREPMPSIGQRDKRVMKTLAQRHGVRTAAFVSVATRRGPHAVKEVADRLGFPVVVKPAYGFGTMNTVRVDGPDELTGTLADYAVNPLIKSKHLIVEEFITGEEVCVDALWHDGQCLSFVVHRYLQPKLTVAEKAGPRTPTVDGSYVLNPAANVGLYQSLCHLQTSVNHALGIRHGATHMEVFVKPGGALVFGEIANRIGGIWIPMMLTEYFGRDIWRIVAEGQVFGIRPNPAVPGRSVGGVNLRPADPGVITRVPSPQELKAIDGVHGWSLATSVGAQARLAHPAEHYLLLTVAADTEDDCADLVGRLAGRVRIETT